MCDIDLHFVDCPLEELSENPYWRRHCLFLFLMQAKMARGFSKASISMFFQLPIDVGLLVRLKDCVSLRSMKFSERRDAFK